MAKPREYTAEEVRTLLLGRVSDLVDYWAKVPNHDLIGRLDGLAFSILAELDGDSSELPRFVVSPQPHPGDKQYHQDNNENWFPEFLNNKDGVCDVAGGLHEHWHEVRRKRTGK